MTQYTATTVNFKNFQPRLLNHLMRFHYSNAQVVIYQSRAIDYLSTFRVMLAVDVEIIVIILRIFFVKLKLEYIECAPVLHHTAKRSKWHSKESKDTNTASLQQPNKGTGAVKYTAKPIYFSRAVSS